MQREQDSTGQQLFRIIRIGSPEEKCPGDSHHDPGQQNNERLAPETVSCHASEYTLTDSYAVGQPEQQTITYAVQSRTNFTQSVTDALGRQTAYTYDTMGNVTSVTRLAGTPQAITTSFAYKPKYNQVTSVTDPLGHTTTFTYEGAGNPTTITNPLGQNTTITYNGFGQPLSVTDPLNNNTQFSYDGTDLSTVTNPLGQRHLPRSLQHH